MKTVTPSSLLTSASNSASNSSLMNQLFTKPTSPSIPVSPITISKSNRKSLNKSVSAMPSINAGVKNTPNIILEIEDEDDLGDDRINAHDLKRLLKSRPDLAVMLYECMLESNIVSKNLNIDSDIL